MKLMKLLFPRQRWKTSLAPEPCLQDFSSVTGDFFVRLRLLLRTLVYYGSKGQKPIRPNKTLHGIEVELNENANRAKPPGNVGNKSYMGRRPSLINQFVADPVNSKIRHGLITRLVSKWVTNSIAADIRRSAARQFLTKGSGVGLGLVGVCVQNRGPSLLTEVDEAEARCQEIRSVFFAYLNNYFKSTKYESTTFNLNNLEFGSFVAKGCNAVVYDAKLKDHSEELAVKMMFNYDAESNAAAIWKSMNKECLTFNGSFSGDEELQNILHSRRTKLKSHPNVIEILGVFTDQVPFFPDAINLYPNALPQRLNEEGFGRNMTLFLVMKKYDISLKEFLNENMLSTKTSLFLLAQLLEGVAHLVKNKVAHRDMKSDNILLDISHGSSTPWLVITDFGFCTTSLQLPFSSDEVSRGGNRALMAPEVVSAVPGMFSYIDYSASDLWACGTIAYEIFNHPNPFSYGKGALQSWSYKEGQLPKLNNVSASIAGLIQDILRRQPSERPTPKIAASLCELLLFSSKRALSSFKSVLKHPESAKSQKLLQWLQNLSTSTLCNRRTMMSGGSKLNSFEMRLRLLFLSDVKIEHLLGAMSYLNVE